MTQPRTQTMHSYFAAFQFQNFNGHGTGNGFFRLAQPLDAIHGQEGIDLIQQEAKKSLRADWARVTFFQFLGTVEVPVEDRPADASTQKA